MKKTLLLVLAVMTAAIVLSACEFAGIGGAEKDTGSAGTGTGPAAVTTGEDSADPTDGPTASTEEPTAATEDPTTAEEDPTTAEEPTAAETSTPGPPEIDYDVNAHLNSKRILIDAGHGFGDPGCTSKYMNGVYERDLTYEFSSLLFDKLKERGYEPLMLRGTDTFPTVGEIRSAAEELHMFFREKELRDNGIFDAYERTLWANVIHRRDPVALMISIHFNALPSAEYVRGTELYYCVDNGCAEPSAKLCGFIETRLREAFPDSRIKPEGCVWNDSYIVTKWTEMPSLLVEAAYVTNPDDAELIFDGEWRETYIKALADGIESYIRTRG